MSNYIKLKDLDSSPLQECLSPEYTSIKAYSYSSLRYSLFLLASTLSIGILPSICFFYPALFCFIAKKDASNFREADCVLIKSFNNKKHIIATKNLVLDDNMAQLFGQGFFDSTGAPTHTIKFFEFRNQRYIYKHSQNSFQRLNLRVSNTISNLIDMKNGLTTIESSFLILFYGLNSIEIDSISIFNMILFKVSHPLYIFQFLSCILWILQEYYTYSIIIISLSLLSITHEIHSSKTHARNMEKQTKILQKSTVIRDKIRVVIDSTELVVGDSM